MEMYGVDFSPLKAKIRGELESGSLYRVIYSTDASSYREKPLGVVYPAGEEDLSEIILFAREHGITLIPRAAGTSLAGQVVGGGLVVDISRHMQGILSFDAGNRTVRVQPGVVLDALHLYTKPHGLFFAPEASTSNRCCIGGMIGNNACGLHSLVYGSVREHLLEATVLLSDGSRCVLRGLEPEEVRLKMEQDDLEGRLYRRTVEVLESYRQEIIDNYPEPEVKRRNMGYALDQLLYSSYFDAGSPEKFNLCKLLAGSEGTLAFVVDATLNLVPVPPAHRAVVCVHCATLDDAFEGNLVALRHRPYAVELMDSHILELSKANIAQNANRFFIQGDPAAILIIELAGESRAETDRQADTIEKELRKEGFGYHYPRVYGGDIAKVWELRKAGLGLLSGMPGTAKPVSVIEDTAVAPYRLPAYMADFRKMLEELGLDCVYHAHISTGELHLRPVLDLKKEQDRKLYREVALRTAMLVKKHRGSLSGEHGDGRLRGEFIRLMFGDEIYSVLREIKELWDPEGLFNRGKIVDTPPMDSSLRYEPETLRNEKSHRDALAATYFDFTDQKGWLCAVEQCNGSGDCRKSHLFGGTMCPSFRASGDEKDTTRARANTLRELLTNPATEKIFDQKEILEVLANCLSCKGCRSECPSNIDMTRFKAEFMQHHYDVCGTPVRPYLVSRLNAIMELGAVAPWFYNAVVSGKFMGLLIKKLLGFAPARTLPQLYRHSFHSWYRKQTGGRGRKVYIFADEFTDHQDVQVGMDFYRLLTRLGYDPVVPRHIESGRTALSKGMLTQARRIARKNISLLKEIITEDTPLVGIEPSCILSFRDEYPDLAGEDMKEAALGLAANCLLYDEFICREIDRGNIGPGDFTADECEIYLHGHCHQKAVASVEPSYRMLSLPVNYTVRKIPSGCCGMAGSFGYEKEHYDMSMQIGGQVLFPAVKSAPAVSVISAPGTSCRQQILDGTGREALHPVQVLYRALI